MRLAVKNKNKTKQIHTENLIKTEQSCCVVSYRNSVPYRSRASSYQPGFGPSFPSRRDPELSSWVFRQLNKDTDLVLYITLPLGNLYLSFPILSLGFSKRISI